MASHPKQPAQELIQRTCRNIQRSWTSDERKQRELRALTRQRMLVKALSRLHRNESA